MRPQCYIGQENLLHLVFAVQLSPACCHLEPFSCVLEASCAINPLLCYAFGFALARVRARARVCVCVCVCVCLADSDGLLWHTGSSAL